MPSLLQYIAVAISIPVLARALWNSARLARANRTGTAYMGVTANGLLPRERVRPATGPARRETGNPRLSAG